MNLEWTVYECYPGAQLIINVNIIDGNLTESGLPKSDWSIYLNSGDRIPITDDMEPLTIRDDMAGIVANDVFILMFEFIE